MNVILKNKIYITAIILLAMLLSANFSYVYAEEDIEFLDIQAKEIDERTVKISWLTNIATQGKILFGESKENLPYFIIDNNKAQKYHEVKLGNLKEETVYYYQIVAYNDNEQVHSFIKKFKTDEFEDITPPRITNIRIAYISGTAAVITWETDEEATSIVEYSKDRTYKNRAVNNEKVLTHQVILRRLKPNTQYFMRLFSEDKYKNISGFFGRELRTLQSDEIDKEDLVISHLRPSGPDDSNITSESIKVEFKTNHFAKGKIIMKRGGFRTQTKNLDYGSSHQAVFSNLMPNSAYNIAISMVDIFNKKVDEKLAVTTKEITASEVAKASVSHDGETGAVCSTDLLNNSGYYGQYYNLPKDAPLLHKYNPVVMAKETGWYSENYFSFSRIDENINFGDRFFPLTEGLSGDPYYFSVYWRAILEVTDDGTYDYQIKSDDDSWVFIDKELTTDLGGKHSAKENLQAVNLTKGLHGLEIYFAERGPFGSFFSFNLDKGVKVHPWPPDCSVFPAYNDVIVAGVKFSYYTPASALHKITALPKVYSIVNGQRHYISSPSSFEEYGYMWSDVRTISEEELLQYPRARLVKGPESPTIYYLYQRPENKWLKINLPSPSVFVSYPDNYWGNVITVTQLDIDSYLDVKLIRTEDDPAVYYLDDNVKYYVSDKVFARRGFSRWEVVEVSRVHLDSYRVGEPLD